MTIYNSDGTVLIQTLVVDDDSDRQHELMGHDRLTLRFSLTTSVDFPARCYCDWEGRRYYRFSQPEVTKKNDDEFSYILTMYTYEYLLSITAMRDLKLTYGNPRSHTGGTKTKFPLTATPCEHLQMIADCLNDKESAEVWRVDYSRTLGMTANPNGSLTNYDGNKYDNDGDMRLVSYENVYCIDALKAVAEAFETELEVEDVIYSNTTYHVICLHKVEYNKSNPLSMKYGKGNGFLSGIVRRNETEVPPLDRLYVQGGEQNIPEHYGQTQSGDTWTGDKSSTLMLPANVDDIRYDGEHLYVRESNGSSNKQYYYDNILRYSYGRFEESGHMMPCYKDETVTPATYSLIEPTLLSQFEDSSQVLKTAEGWKSYAIDTDRKNIYRVKIINGSVSPYRDTNVEGFYDGSEVYPMRVGDVSQAWTVDEDGNILSQGSGANLRPYNQTEVEEYESNPANNGKKVYWDIFDADPDLVNGVWTYKEDAQGNSRCLPNETMTVIFQDGMLAGREFNIQTIVNGTDVKPNCSLYPDVSPTHYRIPLCQSEQDGIVMPTYPFVPAVGDHYIVFHCSMPDEYVTDAEMRMLWQAVGYMFYHDDETYSFNGNVDEIMIKTNWDEYVGQTLNKYKEYMAIGQFINVNDEDMFDASGQIMRVTSIKQKVNNKYSIDISLSNATFPIFNWAKKLSSTVQEVMLRRPYCRPMNLILPRPIYGTRLSRQVSSLIEEGFNIPCSRRNLLLPIVDGLVEASNDNRTRILSLSTAIQNFNSNPENGINWSSCINLKPLEPEPDCKPMPILPQIK